MKYFFLLLLLPLISVAQSNDQVLRGAWVKAKAEMGDGSQIVDRNGCSMDFIKYTFTPDGFVDITNQPLFNGIKAAYKLSGNSLEVGENLFRVLKLTKDTMKVALSVAGFDDSQLPVYYFVRVPLHNVDVKATYDPVLKDSVYQANNIFFPQSKSPFTDFMNAINGRYEKGSFKVSFVIDKKGHVKNYTVLALDSVSKSFANRPKSALNSLDWLPAQKNGLPVNSLVQLTFNTGHRDLHDLNYNFNTISFDCDFMPKAPYPALDPNDAKAAEQYFKDAINQLNSGNSDKAIDLLNKCIGIDNIYLNAYSLRAMIYARTGHIKDACKDWSTLAGLGQVTAAKNLAKYSK